MFSPSQALLIAAAGASTVRAALPTSDLSVRTVAGDGTNANLEGTGTAAQFKVPLDIRYYNGFYYISTYNVISRMNAETYDVVIIAGSTDGDSDNAVGTSAQFGGMYNIPIHPSGEYLLMPDNDYRKIRKMLIASPHSVSTIAGTGANANDSPVNGAGNVATFGYPDGCAISPDGTRAVVAEGNRLRLIDLTSDPVIVSMLAGPVSGATGHVDATGTNARFTSPRSIGFFNGNGALLVMDADNDRIRHVTVPGGVVTTWCGDGQDAVEDGGCNDGASFKTLQGFVVSPDSSKVYITDAEKMIRQIDVSTKVVSYIAGSESESGFQDGPASSALFWRPYALTFSDDGNSLLVVDLRNRRIREIYGPETVAEHIYVHAVDLHGDGWGDDIYLRVQHSGGSIDRRLSESDDDTYTLNCACKVIRLFSSSGDMTISLHHGDGAQYPWEALFTIGYSDGVSAEPFGVIGGADSEFVINNWQLESMRGNLAEHMNEPKNKCKLPLKPPPKSSHVSNETETNTEPDPLVPVRLTLGQSAGESWCDDSDDVHDVTCSAEHHLSPDANLPNILTYPRYYISDGEGHKLIAQGTLRDNAMEDATNVKLPREGAFVFSVSGHDLFESGSLSWDFCATEGVIGQRLHFNMVHGVCKPHYVEVIPELSCEGEWSSSVDLSHGHTELQDSSFLDSFRSGLNASSLVAFVLAACAVALVVITAGRRLYAHSKSSSKEITFQSVDVTEHCDVEMQPAKKRRNKTAQFLGVE